MQCGDWSLDVGGVHSRASRRRQCVPAACQPLPHCGAGAGRCVERRSHSRAAACGAPRCTVYARRRVARVICADAGGLGRLSRIRKNLIYICDARFSRRVRSFIRYSRFAFLSGERRVAAGFSPPRRRRPGSRVPRESQSRECILIFGARALCPRPLCAVRGSYTLTGVYDAHVEHAMC